MGFVSEWMKNDYRHTNGRIYNAIRNFLIEYGEETDEYANVGQHCFQFVATDVPKSAFLRKPKEKPEGEFLKELDDDFDPSSAKYLYELSFDMADEDAKRTSVAFLSRNGHLEISDISDPDNPIKVYSFCTDDKEMRNEMSFLSAWHFAPIYEHKKIEMSKQHSNESTLTA
ncbi:hypothetical protein [Vibrio owensii]|uniref:hypothetical protein n=1 Tax=Vibrio owensii TaxID=696485 RepID=UPI003CC67FE6